MLSSTVRTSAARSSARRAFATSAPARAVFHSASRKVFQKEVMTPKNGKIVLVDFYADWCRPCKMLQPILVKVAENSEYDIDLVTVDTEDLTEMAQEYRISSLPTVVAFRDGQLVDKFVGMRPEKGVVDFIKAAKLK